MTASFKPYPKYKPSGVEWLGSIPDGWNKIPLRHLASFQNGDAYKPTQWTDVGIPIIRIQNLNGGSEFNFVDESAVEERYLVRQGVLLFGWSGNRGTSFGPFRWEKPGLWALNQHIFKVSPYHSSEDWFYWVLKGVTTYIESQAHGVIGMVHITKTDLSGITVPCPSPPDQKAIATFLNSETSKIHETIKELEKSIELLNEEKTCLINECVTGKIDPETRKPYPKYKPSGVEWLGSIPEHWNVTRSKCVLRERNEKSVAGLEEMLSVSHLTGVTKRSEKDVNMFEAETNEGYKLCSKDNLAVNTLWAWMGAMGVAKEDGIVSPAYHVYWIATSMSPSYVDALVRLPNFVAEITRYSKGVWSSRLRLYPEGLFEAWLPLPPRKEQEAIMEAVASRTTQIELLISEKQSLIESLKEYRTSLIHEAVTGKIDLRNV